MRAKSIGHRAGGIELKAESKEPDQEFPMRYAPCGTLVGAVNESKECFCKNLLPKYLLLLRLPRSPGQWSRGFPFSDDWA